MMFLLIFLNFTRWMSGHYVKIDLDHFLPNLWHLTTSNLPVLFHIQCQVTSVNIHDRLIIQYCSSGVVIHGHQQVILTKLEYRNLYRYDSVFWNLLVAFTSLHMQWLYHRDSIFLIRQRRLLRRSQWPRSLRHELSSLFRTLRPWVRIPLKAWMSVCVYSVLVLFCV
jgi:hypothetical protein